MEGLKFENVEHTQLDASTVEAERLGMEQPERKRMLFSLTATLCVGLALALLYLGIRAAHNRPPARVASVQKQAAPVVPVVPPAPVQKAIVEPAAGPVVAEKSASAAMPAPAPVAAPVAAPPAQMTAKPVEALPRGFEADDQNPPTAPYSGVITEPQAGDRYIQVGAFGPRYTQRAIEILQKQQFNPVVAIGPDPNTFRILIGPLNNSEEMNQELTRLQQAGITSLVRRY